jgi:putative MFS transporter
VTTVVVTHAAGDGVFERVAAPRDDSVVGEREVGDGRFGLAEGPFSHYERLVTQQPDGTVEERTDFRLAIPGWRPMFVPPFKFALARRHLFVGGHRPWWWMAPPERMDARASTVLALLCGIGMIGGYLGTLITQTATFASDEFDVSTGGQGLLLASVRAGILLTLVVAALADRSGRRRLLLASAVIGCAASAVGALSPGFVFLGATQVVARGFATALLLLVAIVAAEEMPAGSRAYAVALLAMTQALGAGMCAGLLPVADIAEWTWRLLFVFPLVYLPLVRAVARQLPESRRYTAVHAEASMAGHGGRFWLLAAAAFLGAMFTTPVNQLQNEFLRDERAFSGVGLTLFILAVNTPAGIGLVIGGWMADRHGRRIVGAVGIVIGTVSAVLMYSSSGWPMWLAAFGAATGATLVVPALRVYGAELFPTSLRGGAGAGLELVGVCGAAVGLVTIGLLVDSGTSYGAAFTGMAVAPLLVAVLVLVAFPETARRTLEELNPEDDAARRPPPSR